MIAVTRSDRLNLLITASFASLLLTACAPETEELATPTVDTGKQAAMVDEAAVALERYCIGGLPDIEAVAIAMSADAGAETGKAYTPYEGPDGFVGASLRAAEGFSANTARKSDGRIVCGVALFTPMRGEFETAILDRLVQDNGLAVRGPQREPDQGVTYILDGFVSPATLSFRTRANSDGDSAIGAVITVAEDGGTLPLSEPLPPAEVAAVSVQEPSRPVAAAPIGPTANAAQAPEPTAPARPTEISAASVAPSAPAPAAEPSAPVRVAEPTPASPTPVAASAPAPSSAPSPAPVAAPEPTTQVAAAPAEPSRATPTLPRASNPPSLAGAPSLYEGASFAAFTPQQISEFCRQDWKMRRKPGGRTEYNPCHMRSAFR